MSVGDFTVGALVDLTFTTRYGGVPATLTTPTISVYKNDSLTQTTTGVTLTVDFDGVTGLNHLRIDTTADAAFYAAGSSFSVVLTAGTVGGQSAVGVVVDDFSIQDRYATPVDLSGLVTSLAALTLAVAAVQAKTDNLPTDPADQSLLIAAISAIAPAPAASVIADAVWDEATAGHTTAGTTGKALSDSVASAIGVSGATLVHT
jgi:hypothetical protein